MDSQNRTHYHENRPHTIAQRRARTTTARGTGVFSAKQDNSSPNGHTSRLLGMGAHVRLDGMIEAIRAQDKVPDLFEQSKLALDNTAEAKAIKPLYLAGYTARQISKQTGIDSLHRIKYVIRNCNWKRQLGTR